MALSPCLMRGITRRQKIFVQWLNGKKKHIHGGDHKASCFLLSTFHVGVMKNT